MNLLKEIQETTLMMNIYQQQYLQQQQLLIQQQQNMAFIHDFGGNQMSMLLSLQQNLGGVVNFPQIQPNGVNQGLTTQLIPTDNNQHEWSSASNQPKIDDFQKERDKRQGEEESCATDAKRQKMIG